MKRTSSDHLLRSARADRGSFNGLLGPLLSRTVTKFIRPERAADESDLVARLQAGDERAFDSLVARHHREMLALAQTYVRTRDVAEEVVQDAWLGVMSAIKRFEGRSSLKTWIFRILVNTALTRATREARTMPFSALAADGDEDSAVDPERFRPPGDAYAGHWTAKPGDWRLLPEELLTGRETIELIKRAIEELPTMQRRVITMRDIAGFGAEEVCALLEVSAGNQRILLHRARSRVRAALERHLDA